MKRYLTQDPLKLAAGLNFYLYVAANPISSIDPLGLFEQNSTGSENRTAQNSEPDIPDVYIPKDSDGNPIPLDKHRVNGQDIPLSHPDAEGRSHTVLGGKTSSDTGVIYRQSAEFSSDTWPLADGNPVPLSEVHWGDHGKPHHHPTPHQHPFYFDGKYG